MNSPMVFAFTVEYWLFQLLGLLAVAVEVWAFSDALRRRPEDFARVGERDKGFWLIVTGVALVAGVIGLLTGGGMGLFSLAAVCAASVYLAGPRSQMGRFAR